LQLSEAFYGGEEESHPVRLAGGMDALEVSRKSRTLYRFLLLPLNISGIMPWDASYLGSQWLRLVSIAYQGVCLLLLFLACSAHAEQLFRSSASSQIAASDMALAVGSFIGLAVLSSPQGSAVLCDCFKMIVSPSRAEKKDSLPVFRAWIAGADMVATLVLWFCTIAVSLLRCERLDTDAAVYVSTSALCSFTLLGLSLCLLYACRAFTRTIDVYCFETAGHDRIENAVREWNVLQAVLRKGSTAFELSILVLQATVITALLLCIFGVAREEQPPLALIPVGLISAHVMAALLCAASVTDKCARVPPLINSVGDDSEECDEELLPDQAIEHSNLQLSRQYAVQYIINSAAGFYVFDVRLTSAMVVKVMYVSGALVFALVTNVATK
jgi:hypothetical protein